MNLLKNLQLEELSLVDRPANASATVTLFKRDNSEEEEMEDTLKMSDDMKARVKMYMDKGYSKEEAMKMCGQDMKKADDLDRIRAENERLTKALIDNGFVVGETIEKKAQDEFIEIDGEQINKADVPAVILKRLEEAEIEKAEAALEKRASEELPHFKPDVAKAILKSLDGKSLTGDQITEIMSALKAADKFFSSAMEEVGKTAADGDMTDAKEAMDNLVKSYMEENKLSKKDYAKAYSEVAKTDEGKALIKKQYKGE